MKVEAFMAKFIPDEEKVNEHHGKFFYKDIIFLSNPEQYPELVLGKENQYKTFVTQSHFRGNEKGSHFYVLVFKLTELEEDEDPKDFQIKYTPKKDTLEKELQYDSERQIFFDQPLLKKEKGKWFYSNSPEKAVFGAVNAGVFYFNVYKKGSYSPINNAIYKVCILPSSLSFEKYQEMINDILNIRRELVMEQNTSKQSIQLVWKHTLEEIANVVKQIEGPLLKINKQPKTKIEETLQKIPIRNIKRFNSKTIMNLQLNEGNVKLMSTLPSESADIYENQMIYSALAELKKYLEDSKSHYMNEANNKKQNIENQMRSLLGQYGVKDFDALNRLIDNFNYPTYKLQYARNMLKCLHPQTEDEDTIEVEIELAKYHNGYKSGISFINNKVKTRIIGFQNEHRVFSLDYMLYNQRLRYRTLQGEQKSIPIKGRVVDITLVSDDFKEHVFLLSGLDRMQNESKMTIHAVVKKNSLLADDPLRKNQAKKGNGETYNDTYEYPITILELKGINGVEVPRTMIDESTFESWFTKIGSLEFNQEIKSQINSLLTKKRNIYKQYTDIGSANDEAKKLKEKIDQYLSLPFFNGVTKKKSHWKLTQIFTNDSSYALLWKNLRNLDKKYEFTTDFRENDLVVKKTDVLYEYWILIQILKIFNDTGWKTKEGQSIKEIIDQFLNQNSIRRSGNLEGFEIRLEHAGNWQNMKPDGNKMIEKLEVIIHFNQYITEKKPDYAFEVTVILKDGIQHKKWFFLDAKYRNYQEQNEFQAWFYDMNKVAIDNYLNYFHEKGQPSQACFLIHPDLNEKYTYFGGYLNETMTKNFHSVSKQEDRNPRHRIGSISCIPGKIGHLKTFIKMMIEYHFIEQNTPFICWECGSTNTNVDSRIIKRSNTIKYYISCKDCGEFWVRTHCDHHGHKLVKHINDNYHKEEYSDYPWYVKCPVCDLPDL